MGRALELPLAARGLGALYTMVLDFLASCEQNITIWPAQGVGAVEVATIFGKMRGIARLWRRGVAEGVLALTRRLSGLRQVVAAGNWKGVWDFSTP